MALKSLLRPGYTKAEARFNREIRALGKAEHPNLVKVFTSGTQDKHFFYTTELVEGATLAADCDTLTSRSQSASTVDLATWDDSVGSAYERARQDEKPVSDSGQSSGAAGSSHVSRVPSPPRQSYVERVVELMRQVSEAAHACTRRASCIATPSRTVSW